MNNNSLWKIQSFGQSIWLDYIRRGILKSGELQRLIDEDGLNGVTVNPSILEKAIDGSHDYEKAVHALSLEDKEPAEIYEILAVEDVQEAAGLFLPLYRRSQGEHGFVSLEVSPYLAHDSSGTLEEARRFWNELECPNVMIKVPATEEGLQVIEQLTSEGINVNVTLLFGLSRYRKVAEAYIQGLETRLAKGEPVDHIASVASFFLSRIDVLVDPILEKIMAEGGRNGEIATRLHGQVAIASAKAAFQIYKELFESERFRELIAHGARPQRLLWASTSTKNPAYSDVKYVENLIGPETVNTLPLETLNAYRDHGNPSRTLELAISEADGVLQGLEQVGIDIDDVSQQLENQGVDKFIASYDKVVVTLEKKRDLILEELVDRQVVHLGKYKTEVQQTIANLEEARFSARLWRKDASLWKDDQKEQEVIRNALGWLHVAEKMEENLPDLLQFAKEVKAAGIQHVVHLGMGGSSLAPLVFEKNLAPGENGLPLTVLDTNDPASILRVERQIPMDDTLFIVASKSGSTAETRALGDYFYHWVSTHKMPPTGENFVAITDPSTSLEALAKENGFRRIFLNYSDIGGRYSALSYFGLVPAVLMGVDVPELLGRALRMVHACASCVPVHENPGVMLGAAMGELARQGVNKVTFLMPESIATFGMWLEQLLAESTGKEGTGLLPVVGETIGKPSVYGKDRFFIHFHLKGERDEYLESAVEALRKAGHPVATITMDDLMDLGDEFFRWEIATAAAGSVLGINAFDQPNVQESKDNTNRLLQTVRQEGHLPEGKPDLIEKPLSLFAEKVASTATETLAEFLKQAKPGDYLALMAYLTENPETDQLLQKIRMGVRDSLHLATTLGYGPRFLHSTGQYHKGGPNNGLFLQLTADDEADPEVRDEPYTFGVFKRAEALGDLEALRKHGRRVIRVHLGSDAMDGLMALQEAIEKALE